MTPTKFRPACLLAVLLLSGCGFSAPPPVRTKPPEAPPAPLSSLSATFTIPVSQILDVLNDKTKPEIAHVKNKPVDCVIAKCHLDLVATRTGNFSGSAANGKLSLNLPFAVQAHLEIKSRILKTSGDTNATGVAHSETALKLGDDWKLEPDTNGTVTLSNADLRLGPVKMSVTDLWNHNEEHLSQPLFKAFDRHIETAVKVKDQAKRLWAKVQRPFRVGKSPVAWLVIAPERIRIAGPFTKDNAIVVSLSVDARAHVIVADSLPAPNPIPLPAPAPLAAASNTFSVSVPVLLPYDEAAQLAMQRLRDKPIRVGGAAVKFSKIEFLPSGQDVIVAARFCIAQRWDFFGWFDACGEGYLRGVPQFDAANGKIRVVNVHYDIATQNAILAAMRMLAGSELGQQLETKLVFDVSKDIDKLQNELRTTLGKKQSRGVIIIGDIQSFGRPTLIWTKDGFLASFTASGTIAADLNIKPKKSD
ncbi:MAG TPA: DUF4403 family protein [Rhizomicrobium sp.]|nr:DUF4403 family protein [Rhizomicrobium sp.]